ncbi:MAG: outer membrane beta-barrel protein [bacterium]|nr:outer membrane beta-barrel protein [bacterium]
MKRSIIALSVLCLTAGLAKAAGMNYAFQIGQKGLDSDDWGDIDSQLAVGLHFDMGLGTLPFNLAADVIATNGSDGDLEGGTMEIGLGLRKYFPMGEKIQLYAQGGLAFISATSKYDGPGGDWDETESGIGFALNGGAMYPLGEMFKVGLDLRFSSATADFGGTDVATGGFTYSLVLGMGM